MAYKKASVKVLHRQLGILSKMRERFFYQPGIKVPGVRSGFFRLTGTGPSLMLRNVIIYARAGNSC